MSRLVQEIYKRKQSVPYRSVRLPAQVADRFPLLGATYLLHKKVLYSFDPKHTISKYTNMLPLFSMSFPPPASSPNYIAVTYAKAQKGTYFERFLEVLSGSYFSITLSMPLPRSSQMLVLRMKAARDSLRDWGGSSKFFLLPTSKKRLSDKYHRLAA